MASKEETKRETKDLSLNWSFLLILLLLVAVVVVK